MKNIMLNDVQRKFSLYFSILALFFSFVFFLLFLDNSKKYTSEISIIFVPKSQISATDSEHVIENMLVLPTKLSFYDRLIKYNGNIEDKFSGLSADKRKKGWNDIITVKRGEKSSIVNIKTSGDSPEEAQEISEASTTNLFDILRFYYNIREDASFSVVDGPIAHTEVKNWFWLIIFSLLMGTAFSFILRFILKNISEFLASKKENLTFDFKRIFEASKKAENIQEISKEEDTYEIEIKPKTILTSTKQSPAPKNLPSVPGKLTFIDEDYFRTSVIKGAKLEPSAFVKTTTDKKRVDETKKEAPIEASIEAPTEVPIEPADFHREPTPEELKKRLNQLLRGEL